MTQRVELPIVAEPNRLHDALIAAGYAVVFEWMPGEWIRLTVDDGVDVDALRAFVAAWTPPPPSTPPVVDAVAIAHALVEAVTTAPDFATAQANLTATAAELPPPPT